MHPRPISFYNLSVLLMTGFLLFAGCFARLPDKAVVYFNDFEGGSTKALSVYDRFGKVDSVKIASYNGGKVFGFFNNNQFQFTCDSLPAHNAIKIEFDLYIHDLWDGDRTLPGGSVPDAWLMQLEGKNIHLTTFSNTNYPQSYPYDHATGSPAQPPRADAWRTDLPGVCALKGQANGSSMYRIEYTTYHTGSSVTLACNDALQPLNSYCAKSWSIDNLKLTAILYN